MMIELLEMNTENTLGYRIDGEINKADMKRVFDVIEQKMETSGQLNFYAEVKNLNVAEVSPDALFEELRRLIRHPSTLVNFKKGVLVTDIHWLKKAFEVECRLIPTMTGKSFSFGEEEDALEWLRTDQREGKRLDITFEEMVETSALKVAGGFALGLLTAGLMNRSQRKAVSLGVLAGTVLAGLPLAIKVLNNNRQLFECAEADAVDETFDDDVLLAID